MAQMNTQYNLKNVENISGIFRTESDARRVLAELDNQNLGNDVSVLMSSNTKEYYGDAWNDTEVTEGRESFQHATKLPEGTATGGLAGGIIGMLIGGLTVIGSVVLPGAGLLVAGPLVGALTGGAIGTAAGGLVGALVGVGIPETEAKFYESSLQEKGNILVVAHVPKDRNIKNEVKAIFERCGATSVKVV